MLPYTPCIIQHFYCFIDSENVHIRSIALSQGSTCYRLQETPGMHYYSKVYRAKLQGVLFFCYFFPRDSRSFSSFAVLFLLPFYTIVVHLNSFVANAYYVSNHKHLSDLFIDAILTCARVNAPCTAHTDIHPSVRDMGCTFHFPNCIKCQSDMHQDLHILLIDIFKTLNIFYSTAFPSYELYVRNALCLVLTLVQLQSLIYFSIVLASPPYILIRLNVSRMFFDALEHFSHTNYIGIACEFSPTLFSMQSLYFMPITFHGKLLSIILFHIVCILCALRFPSLEFRAKTKPNKMESGKWNVRLHSTIQCCQLPVVPLVLHIYYVITSLLLAIAKQPHMLYIYIE